MWKRNEHGGDLNLTSEASERRKNETRFWLSLLDCYGTIYPALNQHLKTETSISLAKFDVLAQLERFPDGLSMGALSEKLKVSNGNVSGLVNRLRRDGLVEKMMSKDDRRSFLAILTDAGRERFHKAAKLHADALAQCLLSVKDDTLDDTTAIIKSISDQANKEKVVDDE